MSRLRRVNRLCSRTISGTANMSRHGSTLCSPTVEKILCRSPIFEAVTCRQSAPDPLRERGENQRVETAGVYPLVRPRGVSARSRAPQSATLRLIQAKTPRPLGANTPAAVRVPRSAGAEKGCRPDRANPLTQFVSPAESVQRKNAEETLCVSH